MTEPTEPCHLCGAKIPEGAACTSPKCRQAWDAYHAPLRREQPSRPIAHRGEGETE